MTELEGFEEDLGEEIKIHGTEMLDFPIQDSPYAAPVEIIVDAAAWEQMTRHASEDLRVETGGIMLGQIYELDGRQTIRIKASVAAREAVNDFASIQFTYDAWRQMEEERQQSSQREKLLGWYHTHPGFGAFLSGTDRFTHEKFFQLPWHVALVIDPVKGQYRFYRWDGEGVRETSEFLLQIQRGPAPHPPLNATLSAALWRGAEELKRQRDDDTARLAPALQRLAQSLPRAPSARPFGNLLPLILASSELEPAAIAAARAHLQRERPAREVLRLEDLQVVGKNGNPKGAIVITQGLLAQTLNRNQLHLHGLDEGHSFCRHARLPISVRDLALDENGQLLMLEHRSSCQLYLLRPTIPEISEGDRRHVIQPATIDWERFEAPVKVGKIAAARAYLYVLSKQHLHVLYADDGGAPSRFRCIAVHGAETLGWKSFSDLTDWSVDLDGNLYLLRAKSREIWRFDPVARHWQRMLDESTLKRPAVICAGVTALSILEDGEEPRVSQVSVPDGRLLSRFPFHERLRRFAILHLFGDGDQRLFLVTNEHILATR